MENIEILGVNFEELKKECETAIHASKKGLESKGISTKGKDEKVTRFLKRRVKSGVLVEEIGDDRKHRWAEPEK